MSLFSTGCRVLAGGGAVYRSKMVRCASDWVKVSTDVGTGVSTISMNKPPVNSLSKDFIKILTGTIKNLVEDPHTKGLILTSALPKTFCAGVELTEFLGTTADQVDELIVSIEDVSRTMYSCPVPLIAAINGHAPAGGTVISLAADYRLMVQGNFIVGYNETALGVPALGTWLGMVMASVTGQRTAEMLMLKSNLMSGEEGHQLGLVDRLVAADQLMDEARLEMDRWIAVPAEARRQTKLMMRQQVIQALGEEGAADRRRTRAAVTAATTHPVFQHQLQTYLDSMSKPKAKTPD